MNLIAKLLTVFTLVILAVSPASAKEAEVSYNMTRAMEELQNNNTESGLEYLEKEVSENKKNGIAYFMISTIHLSNLDYGKALNAVELALKYMPKKEKELMSRAYLNRGDILAIEGDTVAAYADLASAIRLDSSNEDAILERAQLYYEQGRYDDSDADYQLVVKNNPGGGYGQMGLGRNAFARKDYEGALNQYAKVIALIPDYSSAYSHRAEVYLAQGKYLKAMDDICRALEIDSDNKAFFLMFKFPADQLTLVVTKLKGLSAKNPHSGEYDFYIAQLYKERRMFAESNEALQRANDIEASSQTLEMLADNYAESGDFATAMDYMNRAIMMDSENDNMVAKLADIRGDAGDIEGAISQWGELINKCPDVFFGYYRRGFFEDISGKTEEALADYEMAIMLAPDYAYSYLGKGDMLERLGRHEEALAAYQKVVELDTVPKSESCAMYALLALNRRDEAIDFMNRVIASDSIAPGIYYDAACLYSRLGDKEKALQYLGTAFEKGFRRFHHVRTDDDLAPVRSLPEFEALISEYESKVAPKTQGENSTEGGSTTAPVEVPFTPAGGVAEVGCTINELPLKFIFDTGASTVSMSMVEANFMMKNGYLTPGDVVGKAKFCDANGDITEGTIINLRQINFGGLKLENVRASVVSNQKAPLLLGQSVLGRLGRIEIDNKSKKLIITPN